MLKLEHVYKKYNNTNYILEDINLILPNKGLVSLVGVSGSGKSTLLNLLGGLDKPDKGNISFNNKEITQFNKKELNWYYNSCLGFIFQQYNLIEYLSVKDNLSLINKNYNYILKKLDIYDLKDKKVSLLSGGEKQRVAIARAILKNPKVLLCDEPTGALDNNNSILIMDILKKLSKDRLVIVVTHDLELANTYSDHIIRIKDGKLLSNINTNDKYTNIMVDKVKNRNIFGIVYNHLVNKRKRNLLISISFAIGLIALGLVLSIASGFKTSLEYEEKNSLASYPIEISRTSYDITDDLSNDINTSKDKVYSYSINQINNITKEYVEDIGNIDNSLKYKVYKYEVGNNTITTTSLVNIDSYYNEFDILYGNKISNNNDVLLMLNQDNRINKYELNQIGLFEDNYNYEDLIDYSFYIGKNKYTIKGIIKAKDNSIMNSNEGIIYDNNNFKKYIPSVIDLYPKDYDNKLIVINKLNEYDDIKYSDISTSIKSISNTLIDSISIILSVFSIITLIVSSILISILTYINIIEYKREIGIYKSLGIKDSNIKNIFYLENILIITKSIMFSIVAINLISIPTNKIIYNLTGLSNVISIDLSTIGIISIISILLSILSSYIPIKNISKLSIVDILRNE